MFIPLLIVTFTISLTTCFVTGWLFRRPITVILNRVIGEQLSGAWQRYIAFAVYIVGISGGVRIWDLEKYISPHPPAIEPIALNADRWTLEVYRTIIGTLQSIAWMLLVFFVFALIAYVILRGFELLHARKAGEPKEPGSGTVLEAPVSEVDVASNALKL
jgi:hypothetical protein